MPGYCGMLCGNAVYLVDVAFDTTVPSTSCGSGCHPPEEIVVLDRVRKVEIAEGHPTGNAVAACQAPDCWCLPGESHRLICSGCSAYVAYSTASFGSHGELWNLNLKTGNWEPICRLTNCWGGVTSLCWHRGEVIGFGYGGGVLRLDPVNPNAAQLVVAGCEIPGNAVAISELYNADVRSLGGGGERVL
eukprot:TRINITY_DN2456_c0_g1_i6.p3 TRINITY_DN2456_c0_g1~~TRINITY_DN2456_c0_g1_i6.p3  ORF type:complete len:189 (-),score=18.55 TRINITY_DN2456_c0_g1_i6:1062-1628(-)